MFYVVPFDLSRLDTETVTGREINVKHTKMEALDLKLSELLHYRMKLHVCRMILLIPSDNLLLSFLGENEMIGEILGIILFS